MYVYIELSKANLEISISNLCFCITFYNYHLLKNSSCLFQLLKNFSKTLFRINKFWNFNYKFKISDFKNYFWTIL